MTWSQTMSYCFILFHNETIARIRRCQNDLYCSVLVTFRTVFWSIFGRGDTDVLSLGEYRNNFTEDIGYIIYGVFNIVTVTVLINMFIAVMTRSFQNIAVSSSFLGFSPTKPSKILFILKIE